MATGRIATKTGVTWLDASSDILRFEYAKHSVCTMSDAKDNVAAQLTLAAGRRLPLLVDIKSCRAIDDDAKAYYAGLQDFSALALLGGSLLGNVIGNFFLGRYNDRNVPTRLFTNEAEAIAWLKEVSSRATHRKTGST
jgi:hypothetical protein